MTDLGEGSRARNWLHGSVGRVLLVLLTLWGVLTLLPISAGWFGHSPPTVSRPTITASFWMSWRLSRLRSIRRPGAPGCDRVTGWISTS